MEKKFIETNEELLKLHSRSVTCRIEGELVEDAKISVDVDGVYLCNNSRGSDHPSNMLGYIYAKCLTFKDDLYEDDHSLIEEIQLLDNYIYYPGVVPPPIATREMPEWWTGGRPMLVYFSDEEEDLETLEDCQMGWLISIDSRENSDYPFDIYECTASTIKESFDIEIKDGLSKVCYEYAKPVIQDIAVKEDTETNTLLEKLEAIVEEANLKIEELKSVKA